MIRKHFEMSLLFVLVLFMAVKHSSENKKTLNVESFLHYYYLIPEIINLR